jgi:thioredoxin 1
MILYLLITIIAISKFLTNININLKIMKISKSVIIVAGLVIIIVLGFIFLSRDKNDLNNTSFDPNKNVTSTSTTSGNVITINENSFQSEVLNSDKPVIVDFYADWCGPCRRLAPIMEQLSTQYSGKIKFCKLNVDQNQNLSAKYRIDAIPHLIVFKNGKPVDNIIGLHSKADMQTLLAPLAE